jgi:hypothetical protein
MALYDNPSNMTGMNDILIYLNSSTNDTLGLVILGVVFFVFFLSFKARWDVQRALIGSLWISMLMAILLNLMGILAPEITIMVLVLAFVSILLKK